MQKKALTLADCPVPILQNEWEWQQFLSIYQDFQPANILEIGSFYGGSLWYYMNANNPKLKQIMSIDLPVPPSDGRYGEMLKCRTNWPTWSEQRNVPIYDVQGNSQGTQALSSAKAIFGNDPIDMLFIDGDHSYEGVRQDYINYSPLVRPGGMIVLHDCYGIEPVQRFWKELRNHNQCIEISTGDGWGIGLLFKK
jgi:predicted O-methyltransferase YrrM